MFRPRLAPPSHVSAAVSPSWRTSLYVTCFAQGTAMLAFGFVLPFLPLYLKEIGVTPESAVVFWSGALVASIVPRERLASSMGQLQSSVYVGIAAGPVMGGVIAQAVGIRAVVLATGIRTERCSIPVAPSRTRHLLRRPDPGDQRHRGAVDAARAARLGVRADQRRDRRRQRGGSTTRIDPRRHIWLSIRIHRHIGGAGSTRDLGDRAG